MSVPRALLSADSAFTDDTVVTISSPSAPEQTVHLHPGDHVRIDAKVSGFAVVNLEDEPAPLAAPLPDTDANSAHSWLHHARLRLRNQSKPSRNTPTTSSPIDDNEAAPLMDNIEAGGSLTYIAPQPVKPGFFSRIAQGISGAAVALKNYVVNHPISSVFSLIAAAPSALNAFTMPSGKSPSQIGKELWDAMTDGMRALSIMNLASSLGVNTILNAYFIPTALDKIKQSVHKKELFITFLSFIFGLGGATSAGAITYNAFLWLPYGQFTAIPLALFAAIITGSSRYLGVKNSFKKMHNLLSSDARNQTEFADALEHIDDKWLNDIRAEFDNIVLKSFAKRCENAKPSSELSPEESKQLEKVRAQPLTNDELELISDQLADALNKLAAAHPDEVKGLIKDKSYFEYVTKYSALLFDISFASIVVGIPYYLTFMQKGFDGVNTIAKFAGNDLTEMNIWLRRLIGVVPGLASGMTAFDHGTKIRTTCIDLAKHLYQHPGDIPFAVLELVALGFGASGPQNIAAGVVANKSNIIGIQVEDSELSTAFIVGNLIAGGVAVNGNAAITKAFFATNKDAACITERDVSKFLRNADEHLVHRTTITKFHRFLDTVNQAKANQESDTPELRRAVSAFVST